MEEVLLGDVIPVVVQVTQGGAVYTGASVVVQVTRNDGLILDFADMHFRSSPATPTVALPETPALSGRYRYLLNTASIVGLAAGDELTFLPSETSPVARTYPSDATRVSGALAEVQTNLAGDITAATAPLATSATLATAMGVGFTAGVDDLHSAHALLAGTATGTALTALQAHGDTAWGTAVGFATAANVTASTTAINAHTDADVAPLATSAGLTAAQAAIIAAMPTPPTAVSIAAAVAAQAITGQPVGSLGYETLLTRKLLQNRSEVVGQTLTVYDDDGVTVLLTATLHDYGGGPIAPAAGEPARSTALA